jgi:ABC-type Mn2+/Zn2+ transport system permease subunit
MGWLTEAFEPEFMQRAVLAGSVAAVASAVVGTWVVLRGLAFIGEALAHGVIPGLALAVLWGFSPAVGALVAALVMGGLIAVVDQHANVHHDTGVGLLFVGMLSVGVIILSRSPSASTDLTGLLFGDILGVTAADLRGQAVAAAIVLVASLVLYRPLLALSFNEDKAASLGLRPRLAGAALLAMVAVSIVASFQAVGTLLVVGLLIGPPAAATLVVRRVPLVMLTAAGFGVLAVVVGLAISYHHDTAGGATIAACSVGWFFVLLLGRGVLSRSHFGG